MRLNCFALAFLLLVVTQVYSIIIELEPNTQKCLWANIPRSQAVLGECNVTLAPNQRVDYVVTDSMGRVVRRGDVQLGVVSKFSFNIRSSEYYETCFISNVPENQQGVKQEINLTIKTAAIPNIFTRMEEIAKVEKIEVELKKIEDIPIETSQNFLKMLEIMRQMREKNKTANPIVSYFNSIYSSIENFLEVQNLI